MTTKKTIKSEQKTVERLKKIKESTNDKSLDHTLKRLLRESKYFEKSQKEIRFNEWISELDDLAYGTNETILNNLKALVRHFVLNEGDINPDILKSLCPDSHKVVEIEEESKELSQEELSERVKEIG